MLQNKCFHFYFFLNICFFFSIVFFFYLFVLFFLCLFLVLKMFSHKPIIVDLRGHLLGRAASLIAKELLCGQTVICVRAELCEISGSLFRNKSLSSQFSLFC